jgi:hypothetical protein
MNRSSCGLTPALLVLMSCAWLCCSPAFAGEKDWPAPLRSKDGFHLVLAQGAGMTHDEALKDALRSAIQQVVKTMVRSETVTDKDKVIKDEILTAAVGLVEGYKERSILQKGGLWRVEIVARVSDKKMSAQLERSKVPVRRTGVDGEGIFAEAVSEMQGERDTIQWVKHLLKDYPWDCFKAEVAEYKEVPNKRTDTTMTLNFKTKYSVDVEQYKKTAAWLCETLEPLSVRKPVSFTLFANELSPAPTYCRLDWDKVHKPKIDESRHFSAWIMTSVKDTGLDEPFGASGVRKQFKLTGNSFVLHQKAFKLFQDKTYESANRLFIRVKLYDKSGKLLMETDARVPRRGLVEYHQSDLMIQPSLSFGAYFSLWQHHDVEVTMPIEQVRLVSRVEMSVVRKE